jgi:transcription-repair coupling factor (superfamily II helicase)
VQDRGQFAVRGGLLDLFGATEDRAVRVDLFGDEIESLRWFSTFTQRSLEDAERVEVAPAAELSADYRELAELALQEGSERPDVVDLLPVDSMHPFLELVGDRPAVLIAGEEELAPALADHWQDVTAALKDGDAGHLYVDAGSLSEQLRERARIRLSSIDQDQRFAFRAQAAEVAARGLREAEPELERLARSGYRTVVTFARRGEGERFAYNLGRLRVRWLGEDETATSEGHHARRRSPGARLHRSSVPAGGDTRAPPVRPPAPGGARGSRRLQAPGRAAQLCAAAHRGHRRARGPRDRAVCGL